MSLLRRNDVNLKTKLRDVLYNQCKRISHMKISGWDKNFYPKQKPRISLSGMQEYKIYSV